MTTNVIGNIAPDWPDVRIQLAVLFGFRSFENGGGARQRQYYHSDIVTLDTVANESRKKMVDSVTKSPAWLCSRDGKLCYYGRLEYDFLAFVPCSLLFLFSPSLSRYAYVRVPSSVQQSSTTLSNYVPGTISRVLSCVIRILPHLGIHFFHLFGIFRSSCFSVAFLLWCRTRYVSTWFAYLDSFATLVFICLTVCDHIICTRGHLSRMNQEGHCGYCWCWVEHEKELQRRTNQKHTW